MMVIQRSAVRFLLTALLIPAPMVGVGLADLLAQDNPANRAWKILQDGTTNADDDTRVAAVHALGLLVKNDRARTLAESKLADSQPAVRAAAAEALGQIGLPASVPALKAAVKDKESEVVFSATSALYHLGDPTAFQVYYAVLTGQRKTGEPLLESQMEMLKDPDTLARIGFETGIGFIPFGGISYKAFKSFRQDNVSPVRAAAAQRLATDPDPNSGKALAAAASDDKWVVRAAAISAIAKRGQASLLPAVAARLDDEQPVVRFNAAAAVVHLSPAPARR
jgi:HEAT repeat protein